MDKTMPKVASIKEIEEIKRKYDGIAMMAAAVVNAELEKAGDDLVKRLIILKGAVLTGISMGKFEPKIDKLVKEKNGK